MKLENGNLFEYLSERGLVYQTTNDEQVKNLIDGQPIAIYSGFDPTADSLHIGHTFSLLMLRRFQKAGHKIIILLGGATAKIGDPSGRNDMRNMVTNEFVNKNFEHIKSLMGRFVDLEGENPAIIVNNEDWMKNYSYVDFMRDIGVHFNVKHMLQNDSCISRLNAGGLTFFEMGYMLIQAYDFVNLNRKYNCKLQIGGSDQWGNIIAGVELGRKLNFQEGKDEEAFQALVTPLLTNSEGKKMGKTAKGTIWISKEKTSVYDFYQYFLNQKDEDVEMLLKYLTDLDMDEIKNIVKQDIRIAKKRMAYEITKIIHGEEEAKIAQNTSEQIFANNSSSENMPTVEIKKDKITNGINIVDLLFDAKMIASKSEGRRLIEQGGICLNREKISDFSKNIQINDCENDCLILQKGKKTFVRVKFVE